MVIWKKPRVEDARRIWSMTVDRGPDRSMMGTGNWGRESGIGLRRVSGGWWKKRGIELIPESTRPLTPILESSNCLSSLSLS